MVCRFVPFVLFIALVSVSARDIESGSLESSFLHIPEAVEKSRVLFDRMSSAVDGFASENSQMTSVWELAYCYHANGYAERARLAYRWLLQKELTNVERARVYYYLAQLEMDTGNLDELVRLLEVSVSLLPNYENSYECLGQAYFKSGDSEQSERAFQAALALNETNSRALMGVARIALGKGDEENGISLLEKAVEVDPNNVNGLSLLSVILDRRGDARRKTKVDRMVSQALILPVQDPWMVEVEERLYDKLKLNYLVEDYKRAQDYEKALEYLDRIEDIDTKDPSVFLSRSQVYEEKGELEKSVDALRRGIAMGGDVGPFYSALIRNLRHAGKVEEALAIGEEGLALSKVPPAILFEYAKTQFESGWLDRAEQTLKRLGDRDPYDIEALLLKVRIGMESGKYQDVISDLNWINQLAMADFDAQIRLALLHMGAGMPEEAMPYIERALELKPRHFEAVELYCDASLRLGDWAVRSGEFEAAAMYFGKVLIYDPGNRKSLAGRAMALVEAGAFQEAESAMLGLINEVGRDPSLLMTYADLLFNNGKKLLARSIWMEVVNQAGVDSKGIALKRAAQQRLGSTF